MKVVSEPLLSKQTLRVLQEYLVHWSVLRDIEALFEDAGIPLATDYVPNETSERRSLIKRYFASCNLNDWADVKKLLRVFEAVLIDINASQDGHYATELEQQYQRLTEFLDRDGFVLINNRLTQVSGRLTLNRLNHHATELSAKQLHVQIRRIEAAVEDDPDLAIGTAKELVESTCKTILSERGVQYERNWDLAKLVKATSRELNLTPDDIPDSAKAAKTIRILLSNLATITRGLAEVRNAYGTGHGKEGRRSGLGPRHARLAVGAATTLAAFLLDTHMERTSDVY